MKIERNGIEYELTAQELYAAYCEQQHLNDVSDIELNLDTHLSEDEIKDIENSSDFFSEAAYALRKNLDDFGLSFEYAVSTAIEETYNDFKA